MQQVENQLGRGPIDNIQMLRTLAALRIVFVHLDVFLAVLGIPPSGYGGVDLFFIISGFIMIHSTRGRPLTATEFFWRRFTRIVPLYWSLTLAVFAVAVVKPHLLQATSRDPSQLFRSLAFIPYEKSPGLVHPVLFVGWTLNYEMFFYTLFALSLLPQVRRVGPLLVAAVMTTLVTIGFVFEPKNVLLAFYTRPVLLEFAVGMALSGIFYRAGTASFARRRRIAIGCTIAFAIAAVLSLMHLPLPVFLMRGVPAALLASTALAWHIVGIRLKNRLLLALANASYAIYLTHPFVTQAVQKAFRSFARTEPRAVGMIAVTVVLVCIVGWLTHTYFEKPLTKLTKQLVDRVRQKPHADAAQALVGEP